MVSYAANALGSSWRSTRARVSCDRLPFGMARKVEHTTSISSGIVRSLDVPLEAGTGRAHELYLVAPGSWEADVRAQLSLLAFQRIGELTVRFIPYGALAEHRESMARFGSGSKAIEAIAKAL